MISSKNVAQNISVRKKFDFLKNNFFVYKKLTNSGDIDLDKNVQIDRIIKYVILN